MRILFITRWYPTERNPVSGVFVRDIAEAASISDQVTVLFSYPENEVRGLYKISKIVEGNVTVIRVKYKKTIPELSYLTYLYTVLRTFQELRNELRPDIIHAHSYLAGLAGVILGRLCNVPVIVSEHVFAEKSLENESMLQCMTNNIRKFVAKLTLNCAELVTTPTSFLREYLESIGVKSKIKIIPNPVNVNIFYPTNIKHKRYKKILFVGGLHPVKGLNYLLVALKQLRKKRSDFLLDVVGDGPFKNKYEKLARDLDIDDIVTFHGQKSKEEVVDFMRECDFLVLPSVWEAFGIVLIEAMACGKPVVATSCGQREIVNERTGILVPPKNSTALANAIDYMLDNCQNYSSHEIARYVKEKFSYKAVGKLLHRMYLQVLQEYR